MAIHRFHRSAAAAAVALSCAQAVLAVPVTVSTPFFNLEHRNVNSLGASVGEFVRFGATSVLPNGNGGTTGVAVRDADGLTLNLGFAPFPLAPNWFSRYFVDDPAYRGNWTLKFSNGADSKSVPVSLAPTAAQAPFVNSITLSGTSEAPTFSWAPPPGAHVDAYRINIFDKSIISPSNSGLVVSFNRAPSVTSYTVNPADFTVPGYAFALGKHYAIEISLIQTKDGTSNASNTNLQAIARSYADFTPTVGGGPQVNLPVVLDNGVYKFDMAITAGQTYYIDPEVAVGYDYAIGAGNPNFASVTLPTGVGDGRYDLYGYDAQGQAVLLAADWQGGAVYSFAAGGVGRFKVLGIETGAALDPNNATAFVTGLTFTGSGQFTGTQTPITVNVPEPATVALWCAGLLGLGAWRRRQPARH